MLTKLLREDVEGNLVQVADGDPHLAKCLSAAVAWQTFDVEDLTNVAEPLVAATSRNLEEGLIYLHYQPKLKVFSGLDLRNAIKPSGPLGPWMAAELAHDLCLSLATLHDEDIPQLVLHPERVGQISGRFVLLPTLAGILPPLAQFRSNAVAGWLHYVAPEVLRTRGIDKSVLFAADIYAWGRMLHLLCAPDWQPELAADHLKLIERRVEAPEEDSLPPLPPGFEELAGIWAQATALRAADRPTLAQLQQQIDRVRDKLHPEQRFSQLLAAGQLAEAESLAADAELACQAGFPITQRSLHLMAADLCLARTPPDPGKAIMRLDLAESAERYEADVQRRLGRAYLLFTANPQHLKLSCKAYERAAEQTGYASDVQNEWVTVLRRLNDPDYAFERLQNIHPALRAPAATLFLVELLAQQGYYGEAWEEIAMLFPGCAWNQALFYTALGIAEHLDAAMLVAWLRDVSDRSGFAAPRAIAHARLGRQDLAEMYMEEARSYDPSTGA